jgi:Family of unknown function (DUF5681)
MAQKRPLRRGGESSHDVGYGKPPDNTKFQKGRSGNPAGRPRTTTRFYSVLKNELDRPVKLRIDGECREVTNREAIAQRLFAKALRGDIRALEMVLRHIREKEAADPPPKLEIRYYKDTPCDPKTMDVAADAIEVATTATPTASIETTVHATAGRVEPKSTPAPPPIRTRTEWTGRMRAPAPYSDFYIRDRRYRANGDGFIENVAFEDCYRLRTLGCEDA